MRVKERLDWTRGVLLMIKRTYLKLTALKNELYSKAIVIGWVTLIQSRSYSIITRSDMPFQCQRHRPQSSQQVPNA